MSEKRFHLDMELVPYSIVDLNDGTSYPIEDEGIFEDVVKLLNEIETERIAYRDKFENCKRNCVAVKKSGLNDEQQSTIEQLNLAIDDLLSHTSCDEIKKENEQLKKQRYDLYTDIARLVKENEQLKEENEELKREMKKRIDLRL